MSTHHRLNKKVQARAYAQDLGPELQYWHGKNSLCRVYRRILISYKI